MRDIRIAVLGAGGVGACAALELANRGYSVDLYDESSEAVTRASKNNEGKIHLGLVYARDPSLKTARTMILGAVHFMAYLSRWIDISADDVSPSAFYYAVHHGSMTTPDALERYYSDCKRLLEDACSSTGLSYLGIDRTLVAERLPSSEVQDLVSGDYCSSVFRTSERAVDSRAIAERLRAAITANPRIRFITNAKVSAAADCGAGRLRVSFQVNGDDLTETYDRVANTLWHGRLAVDATLGLAPDRGWIHRYKMGGWINASISPATAPSLTFVLGPFGDIVNFGRRGLYFSWYPTGLVGKSMELSPPDWESPLSAADRSLMLRRSYEELVKRCPRLISIPYSESIVEVAGGMIFAWGSSDIDIKDSRLHTRHEIGIHSQGNYHSVNTGKYTMCPYLGFKTADRLLGIS